jgi:Fe-S-cluster containining protein
MVKKQETNLTKDESNPCDGCTKCCSYVALEIDEPTDKEDFDHIRWYLVHKNVSIFIDHDDSWNIEFNSPCENLDEHGWCKIYGSRPLICKQYTTENCEKYGGGNAYKLLFTTLDEFETWFSSGKIIPK